MILNHKLSLLKNNLVLKQIIFTFATLKTKTNDDKENNY
jgi:hypothetical protein